MTPPTAGVVLRYRFLWKQDEDLGFDEGDARPVAVVVATPALADGARVFVVAVTRAPPRELESAIEPPAAVKAQLGLDDDRSWVVIDQVNSIIWPGYDPESISASCGAVYGRLPPRLTAAIVGAVDRRLASGRLRIIPRDPEP